MKGRIILILSELIWLLVSLVLSLSCVILFWNWDFKNHLVKIRILGSSVAFSDFDLVYCLWLLLILIVYFLKEGKSKYTRVIPNLIAISAGVLFIISLSFINVGWTWYPPLIGLGQEGLTDKEFDNILLGFRISAGAFVLIVIYKWIKSRTAANTSFVK